MVCKQQMFTARYISLKRPSAIFLTTISLASNKKTCCPLPSTSPRKNPCSCPPSSKRKCCSTPTTHRWKLRTQKVLKSFFRPLCFGKKIKLSSMDTRSYSDLKGPLALYFSSNFNTNKKMMCFSSPVTPTNTH